MRGLAPWLAAVIGASLVGVAWFLLESGAAPEHPRILEGVSVVEASTGGQAEILARLERIERRLDAIVGTGRASTPGDGVEPTLLGRSGEVAPGSMPPVVSAAPAEAIAVSEAALERVVERLEKKKQDQRFAKMSDEQMIAEARRLRDRERDLNASRLVLENLLTRELDDGARAQALMDLGAVHRGMQEFEPSERRLREAMRLAGEESELGVQAGYQLVWTYSQAKQPGRGLAVADRLLQAGPGAKPLRPWIRWAAARMALDSGDRERARTDFGALLEEFRGNKQYQQIAADATRMLKELE